MQRRSSRPHAAHARSLSPIPESTEPPSSCSSAISADIGGLANQLIAMLQPPVSRRSRQVNEWIQNDRFSKFLVSAFQHYEPSENDLDIVCSLAQDIYFKEISSFLTTGKLRQPLDSSTAALHSTFSFESVWSDYVEQLPRLTSLFQTIIQRENACHLRARRKYEKGPLSTSSHQDNQEDRLSAVSYDQSDDSDCQSDDSDCQTAKRKHDSHGRNDQIPLRLSKTAQRKAKRQTIAMIQGLSSVMYGRNQRINHIPAQIGYYLYASRTSKRVIEVLNQAGVSVSYQSVIRGLRAIARSNAENVRQFRLTNPRFIVVCDNMDFYSKVRTHTLSNESQLKHYTVGYVFVNDVGSSGPMFTKADIQTSKAIDFTESDLLPNNSDVQWHLESYHNLLYEILHLYFPSDLTHYLHKGKPLTPVPFPSVFQIPIQKTKMETFSVWDKNEAIINEMTDVLREMQRELGCNSEDLTNAVIGHVGDGLTLRNIRFV